MRDSWLPAQYEKFKNERSQPFFDLIALVERRSGLRGVDLGCGTGQLTRIFHESLEGAVTRGIDNSKAMISQAKALETASLRFEEGDIQNFREPQSEDVIISNAAIQWCKDHPRILQNIRESLKPEGQLALQMPMNHDYPTHVVASRVASRPEFKTYLDATESETKALVMLHAEDYAELLYQLGFKRQRVFVNVYTHLLESREAVIEWVKGTLLTYYESRLPAEVFQSFMLQYREELFRELADNRPFFFPFKRVLMWGSLKS